MKINNVLLIKPEYYFSESDDLEQLYNSGDLARIMKAAEKCEKFHSYFHYEESFFNTLLAIHAKDKADQLRLLEKAAKLSPVNKVALLMLKELTDKPQEIELKLDAVKAQPAGLSRPHDSFLGYMRFAAENRTLETADIPRDGNFWHLYEHYEKTQDLSHLMDALKDLEARHVTYHKEAAKIYHAAHTLALDDNNDALAKFAILKAKNLDPGIKEL